jgi:hypothetical protein
VLATAALVVMWTLSLGLCHLAARVAAVFLWLQAAATRVVVLLTSERAVPSRALQAVLR